MTPTEEASGVWFVLGRLSVGWGDGCLPASFVYRRQCDLPEKNATTPKSSNPSIGKGLRVLLIGGQMTEGPESHPEGIPHQYLKKVEHLNGQ